jgi:hypothetical protein
MCKVIEEQGNLASLQTVLGSSWVSETNKGGEAKKLVVLKS